MPATAADAFARIETQPPQRSVNDKDLYGGFTELGPWKRAAPRLNEDQVGQAAFMAHGLRQAGAWETWVARFPRWAAPAAHRAVIGKAPYHAGPRLSQPHVDGVAELLLGVHQRKSQ